MVTKKVAMKENLKMKMTVIVRRGATVTDYKRNNSQRTYSWRRRKRWRKNR